jgi:hypothetical protein
MFTSNSDDKVIQEEVSPSTATESASKKEDEITRTEPIELDVITNTQDASIENQTLPTAEEPPNSRTMAGWRLYVLTFG